MSPANEFIPPPDGPISPPNDQSSSVRLFVGILTYFSSTHVKLQLPHFPIYVQFRAIINLRATTISNACAMLGQSKIESWHNLHLEHLEDKRHTETNTCIFVLGNAHN